MNKIFKKIAFAASICLVSTFLFAKSVNYVRNNEVLSLLTENVEALSYIDYFYVENNGSCGVILRQNVGTEYEYWYIRCKISKDQMTWAINGWQGNNYSYCSNDKSCANSTWCGPAYR